MTNQTDRQALEQARQSGIAQAVSELRTFTGIPGYRPELTETEHRAYVAYERDLAHGLEVWMGKQRSYDANVQRLIERRNQASRVMDDVLQRRKDERADGNVGGRIVGALQDVILPEKREHAALEKSVEEAWQLRYSADARVSEISTELSRVSNWVEQMFADVDELRATRQENDEAARRARECAARDLSSRWCTVYALEVFIAENERRVDRPRDNPFIGGWEYGNRWRRDGDDFTSGDGNWALHWIGETSETVLELTSPHQPATVWLLGKAITSEEQAARVFQPIEPRMRERNSIALVLDAYRAIS